MVLCGQISLYNTNLPYPFPIPKETAEIIAQKNIKRLVVLKLVRSLFSELHFCFFFSKFIIVNF